jgi:hypothetical protein
MYWLEFEIFNYDTNFNGGIYNQTSYQMVGNKKIIEDKVDLYKDRSSYGFKITAYSTRPFASVLITTRHDKQDDVEIYKSQKLEYSEKKSEAKIDGPKDVEKIKEKIKQGLNQFGEINLKERECEKS